MSLHRILQNDVKMTNANSSDFTDVQWKDFHSAQEMSG